MNKNTKRHTKVLDHGGTLIETIVALSLFILAVPLIQNSIDKRNKELRNKVYANQIQDIMKYLRTYSRVKQINWAAAPTIPFVTRIYDSGFKETLIPYGLPKKFQSDIDYTAIMVKTMPSIEEQIPVIDIYLIASNTNFNRTNITEITSQIIGYEIGYVENNQIFTLNGNWEIDTSLWPYQVKENDIIIKDNISIKTREYLHRDFYADVGEEDTSNLNVMQSDLYIQKNDIKDVNNLFVNNLTVKDILIADNMEINDNKIYSYSTGNDNLVIKKGLTIKEGDTTPTVNYDGTDIDILQKLELDNTIVNGTLRSSSNLNALEIDGNLTASNFDIKNLTIKDEMLVDMIAAPEITVSNDFTAPATETSNLKIDNITAKDFRFEYDDTDGSTETKFNISTAGILKIRDLKIRNQSLTNRINDLYDEALQKANEAKASLP
jgi:type II secretory pathway pseudopilin PulG